jgi:hypothetical protein
MEKTEAKHKSLLFSELLCLASVFSITGRTAAARPDASWLSMAPQGAISSIVGAEMFGTRRSKGARTRRSQKPEARDF